MGVSSGSAALAFLRHEPPFVNVPTPALILLDLNIPRPDGRAILILLCRLAAYQKTPVVIITGSKKATEEAPCLQLGAMAMCRNLRTLPLILAVFRPSCVTGLGRLNDTS